MTGKFSVTFKQSKKTWKTAVIQMLAVSVMLASIFFSFYSVFEVEVPFYLNVLAMGVYIPVSSFIFWNRKSQFKKILLTLILIVVVCIADWQSLYTGLAPYMDKYIEFYNQYYAVNVNRIVIETDIVLSVVAFSTIGFLFSMIFYMVLEKGKGIVFSILVVMLPAILAATIGKMPDIWSGLGMMLAIYVYLIVYRQNGTVMGIGALMLLLCCSFAIQPVIANYKEENIEKYKEIKKWLIDVQEFQLEDINNLTSFNPTGETAMEVVVTEKPISSVYLKAYVGTTYTGSKWEKLSSSEFSEIVSRIGGADKKRELINEPFVRIQNGSSSLEIQQISISLVNASKEFAYTPYFVSVSNKNGVYLDAYVKANGKVNQFEYYDSKEVLELSRNSLAGSSELWKAYREFVKKTYVKEYEELEELTAFCDDYKYLTANLISEKIDGLFSSGFRYSRMPGSMPEGNDFIEGFLFDKKVGFCVHFASAATLIYQISGIPARYVEGYKINPSEFERQEDGTYKAIVTDEMAHAWSETFDDDFGWVVREHTLSYMGETIEIAPVVDETEELVVDEPEIVQETSEGEQEGSNEIILPGQSENEEEQIENANAVKETAIYFGVIFITLILLAVVIFMQGKIRWMRKRKSFRLKTENKGIRNIYNEIYKLCVFSGLEVLDDSERKKVERMSDTFPVLTKEEWMWIYESAEKARFSKEVFDVKDQKEMYRLYMKLRREIIKNLNRRQKIIYIFFKGI